MRWAEPGANEGRLSGSRRCRRSSWRSATSHGRLPTSGPFQRGRWPSASTASSSDVRRVSHPPTRLGDGLSTTAAAADVAGRARELYEAAESERTRRAYALDWRAFTAWRSARGFDSHAGKPTPAVRSRVVARNDRVHQREPTLVETTVTVTVASTDKALGFRSTAFSVTDATWTSLAQTGPFTVEALIRPSTLGVKQVVVSKRGNPGSGATRMDDRSGRVRNPTPARTLGVSGRRGCATFERTASDATNPWMSVRTSTVQSASTSVAWDCGSRTEFKHDSRIVALERQRVPKPRL